MTAHAARVFHHHGRQAIEIPREFELPGDQAMIVKEGDRLVIEPARRPSLLAFLAGLEPIEEAIEVDDRPPDPVNM